MALPQAQGPAAAVLATQPLFPMQTWRDLFPFRLGYARIRPIMTRAYLNLAWRQKHAFVPAAFALLLALLVGCPSVEKSSTGKSPPAAAKSAAPDTQGQQRSPKTVDSPESSCHL